MGLELESCGGASFGFDSPFAGLSGISGSIGNRSMGFDVCQVIVLISI
jgi:hypothetical protein